MSQDEIIAAELALGVLDGPELAEAQARAEREPAFAADVARWQERFAPFFAEIDAATPSSDLWPRIERALGHSGAGGANVAVLRRSVRRWQGVAGLALAASVALALLTVPPLLRERPVAPPPTPAPVAAGPVLVASLGNPDDAGAAAVTFVADTRALVVSLAALPVPEGRDAELWIIPAGGDPVSLGVVSAAAPARRQLGPALAAQFRSGATLAVTIEPSGGSPTGKPTGDIVVSGPLLTT